MKVVSGAGIGALTGGTAGSGLGIGLFGGTVAGIFFGAIGGYSQCDSDGRGGGGKGRRKGPGPPGPPGGRSGRRTFIIIFVPMVIGGLLSLASDTLTKSLGAVFWILGAVSLLVYAVYYRFLSPPTLPPLTGPPTMRAGSTTSQTISRIVTEKFPNLWNIKTQIRTFVISLLDVRIS